MNLKLFFLRLYSVVLRMLKPNSGLTLLSFNSFTNKLFGNLPVEQYTKTNEGIHIKVRIDDYHGRILWLTGSNDYKVARVAKNFSKTCDAFLDIGANYSTIGFSVAAQNPQCQVHLFEPQPYLVSWVSEAIKSAGMEEQVHIHSVALMDRKGVFRMAIPGNHSGMATLVMEERFGDNANIIDVPTVETQAYIRPLVGSSPFGVKIDIEGAEEVVLPGLLCQANMKFCIFEGANSSPEIINLLSREGFVIFGLCRTVMSVKIQALQSKEEFRDFHDLVAIRTNRNAWPNSPLSLRSVTRMIAEF